MTENKKLIFGLSPHGRGEFSAEVEDMKKWRNTFKINCASIHPVPFYVELKLDEKLKLAPVVYV